MVVEILDRIENNFKNAAILDFAGAFAASQVQANIVKKQWAANSPLTIAAKGSALPLRDRGQLLSSISHRREGDKAIVGSNHPGAAINHTGGTIRPKKAKFLWIPAGGSRPIMRRFGPTPTACIAGLKAAGYGIYRRGKAVFARKKVAAGETAPAPIMIYILKESVTIPARGYFKLDEKQLAALSSGVTKRFLS